MPKGRYTLAAILALLGAMAWCQCDPVNTLASEFSHQSGCIRWTPSYVAPLSFVIRPVVPLLIALLCFLQLRKSAPKHGLALDLVLGVQTGVGLATVFTGFSSHRGADELSVAIHFLWLATVLAPQVLLTDFTGAGRGVNWLRASAASAVTLFGWGLLAWFDAQ